MDLQDCKASDCMLRYGNVCVCTLQAEQLIDWCHEQPLTIEVHDRTAIPDPPEFPIRSVSTEGSAAGGAAGKVGVCKLCICSTLV